MTKESPNTLLDKFMEELCEAEGADAVFQTHKYILWLECKLAAFVNSRVQEPSEN